MKSSFPDNFSKQSNQYLRYRPQYPEGLYTYLASLCPKHELAWDCGTGNGQAAIGLAALFRKVEATDPSAEQIKNAQPLENINYKIQKAEDAFLEAESIDLVTVANALHWFEFAEFYSEVARVLKPGGVLAAWAYGNPSHDAELNKIVSYLHDVILGDYWLPQNRLVEAGYKTIPFPYQEIVNPVFKIEKELSYEDLMGLFSTWSAVQRYKDKTGKDPVSPLEKELSDAWGDRNIKKVFSWDLVLKVGRK